MRKDFIKMLLEMKAAVAAPVLGGLSRKPYRNFMLSSCIQPYLDTGCKTSQIVDELWLASRSSP
jgi:hypothetical protein